MKVSVNGDGTVLFFTPKGRMLVDAPKPPLRMGTRKQGVGADASVHPGAAANGEGPILSNGAALYCDSAIPWEIEAAAREAAEDSLEARDLSL